MSADLSTETPADVLAWQVELDRLDLDLLRVDRLVHAMEYLEQPDWATPAMSTPLPASLLSRAQDIHLRQQQALVKVARALRRTRGQQAYADRVLGDHRPEPQAVYLDVGA